MITARAGSAAETPGATQGDRGGDRARAEGLRAAPTWRNCAPLSGRVLPAFFTVVPPARALAGRDHGQRVGPDQRGEDVRALGAVGVATAGAVAAFQADADGLLAPRIAGDVHAKHRLGPSLRTRRSPQRGERRGDEQRERDHGRNRIAREAEYEAFVARVAEPGRLAGCRATLQNTSRTPSSASAGLTWSWGPTETPPEMITTSDASARPRCRPGWRGGRRAGAGRRR